MRNLHEIKPSVSDIAKWIAIWFKRVSTTRYEIKLLSDRNTVVFRMHGTTYWTKLIHPIAYVNASKVYGHRLEDFDISMFDVIE